MKLEENIGGYTLKGWWSEYDDKNNKHRYEGSLGLSLWVGSSKQDIKKEDIEKLKEKVNAFSIVYCMFEHHTIFVQYIFKTRSNEIFNAMLEILKERLIK